MIRFLGQLTFFTVLMNVLASSKDEKPDLKTNPESDGINTSSDHDDIASTSIDSNQGNRTKKSNGHVPRDRNAGNQEPDEGSCSFNCCGLKF